jgi:hypothetical protein
MGKELTFSMRGYVTTCTAINFMHAGDTMSPAVLFTRPGAQYFCRRTRTLH